MNLTYLIRPRARDDIDTAHSWYEMQRIGRGDEFLTELRDLIQVICETPELYGRVLGDLRAAPLPNSLYIVYYKIESPRVSIYAVQHGTANPRKWQRRG